MKAETLHLESAMFEFLARLASMGARQGTTRGEVEHQSKVGLRGATDDLVDPTNRCSA